jgi:hypothetical protein
MNTDSPHSSLLTFHCFYWDADEHGYTRIRIQKELNKN